MDFSLLIILRIKACSKHIQKQIHRIPYIISYGSKTILENIYTNIFQLFL